MEENGKLSLSNKNKTISNDPTIIDGNNEISLKYQNVSIFISKVRPIWRIKFPMWRIKRESREIRKSCSRINWTSKENGFKTWFIIRRKNKKDKGQWY